MNIFATNTGRQNPVLPNLTLDNIKSHSLTIRIKTTLKIFIYSLTAIAILNSIGQTIRFLYGHDYLLGFTPLFYMYSEQNVPTWFSSLLLLTCSGLLYVIASTKRRNQDRTYGYWFLLCFAFLFLSVDETATIHEKVGNLTDRLLPHAIPGAWAIPYAILAGIFGTILIKFLLSLPRKHRILFCLSGFLYVGGALGMEVFEAVHVLRGGANDPIFVVLVTIEETMEAGSIILFLYSLLLYIKEHVGALQIRVR